jgi:uncharacterized membrane protein YdfJ with MMPL/SSD domain
VLRLARWSTTHRLYVVLGWLVLLLAVNGVAQSAGTLDSEHAGPRTVATEGADG